MNIELFLTNTIFLILFRVLVWRRPFPRHFIPGYSHLTPVGVSLCPPKQRFAKTVISNAKQRKPIKHKQLSSSTLQKMSLVPKGETSNCAPLHHHRPTQGQPKCCPYRCPATTRGDTNHCCIPSNTSLPHYIMGSVMTALGLSLHLGCPFLKDCNLYF